MKKFLLILAVVAMLLPGCKKIEESIDALENRIEVLENETIPTIDEQIAAINVSLDALDTTDKELKGYIDGLQAIADNLQKQIDATNTKIDEVKSALQNEISTAKAEVLAELEALETELKNELSQINATIETLKAKDAELDQKITDLKSYVDTELGQTADWVNATFATLTQYNALVAEVTTIKAQIVAINESIADLETRLTTKINEDIANAVSALNSTIQQKVKEITDAYTNAVKTAKEEVTAAYTAAIATAISNLETSLRSWVGEQLSNYYTIAEMDAKIANLEKAIADGDSALQQQLNELKSQLESAKQEITEAYKKAIEEAIETNNGVINTKIASEIAAVNKRIDEAVAAINAKITTLQAQVDKNTEDIAKLLARIQSVSYVPTYSDGKATMKYANRVSQVTLDFKVSPKDAVVELANIWQNAVKVEAIYTQTRAVSFIEMPIVKFEADAESGVISVIASGENLSEEFFAGTQETSVALSISDGNSSNTSEYVPMVTQEVDMYQLSVPANQIWYTSTDGNIVEPTREDAFSASIRSNTYKNGVGIIEFNNNVSKVLLYAFCDQETKVGVANLQSIILPEGITDIGEYAFYSCQSLTEIVIPSSLSSIKAEAFSNSYSIKKMYISDLSAWCRLNFQNPNTSPLYNGTAIYLNGVEIVDLVIPSEIEAVLYANLAYSSIASVTIHEGVTLIKGFAFHMCNKLKFVYCKPTTPPKVSYSTAGYWRAFYGNAKGRMIYVPRESVDAYKAADGWSDYADYIVGYDF